LSKRGKSRGGMIIRFTKRNQTAPIPAQREQLAALVEVAAANGHVGKSDDEVRAELHLIRRPNLLGWIGKVRQHHIPVERQPMLAEVAIAARRQLDLV
jgi:hypothetical protein